jgi:hypothetical protein
MSDIDGNRTGLPADHRLHRPRRFLAATVPISPGDVDPDLAAELADARRAAETIPAGADERFEKRLIVPIPPKRRNK